jgi:hypothetical protein
MPWRRRLKRYCSDDHTLFPLHSRGNCPVSVLCKHLPPTDGLQSQPNNRRPYAQEKEIPIQCRTRRFGELQLSPGGHPFDKVEGKAVTTKNPWGREDLHVAETLSDQTQTTPEVRSSERLHSRHNGKAEGAGANTEGCRRQVKIGPRFHRRLGLLAWGQIVQSASKAPSVVCSVHLFHKTLPSPLECREGGTQGCRLKTCSERST